MSDELVERLRYVAKVFRDYDEFAPEDIRLAGTVPDKAADRIEADARRNAELEAALRPFADFADGNVDNDGWSGREQGARIVDWFGPSDFRAARAALAPTGGSDGSAA
jgi:hypothetical protein